jgi:outer membrane lipoprotein-sorting protein
VKAWAAALLAAGLALGARAQAPAPAAPPTLAAVLAALDRAALTLRSLSANVTVDDYTALVADTSTSTGRFDYARSARGPRYALRLTRPADRAKTLVYRDDTAWVYVPASRQVDVYPLRRHAAAVEQYLLLGLGSSGRALAASYHIVLDPPATLDGAPAVQLTLTPRDPAAAAKIPKIVLWFDPRTWVEVQQQVFQPGGDYHRVHYTAVRRNPRLPDDAFSTRFPGATVVRHQP